MGDAVCVCVGAWCVPWQIDDIFRIAIDPIFPPPAGTSVPEPAGPTDDDAAARPRFKLLYSFGQPRERLAQPQLDAEASV